MLKCAMVFGTEYISYLYENDVGVVALCKLLSLITVHGGFLAKDNITPVVSSAGDHCSEHKPPLQMERAA